MNNRIALQECCVEKTNTEKLAEVYAFASAMVAFWGITTFALLFPVLSHITKSDEELQAEKEADQQLGKQTKSKTTVVEPLQETSTIEVERA